METKEAMDITFYNKVMSHNEIYSLMYSPYKDSCFSLEEQIISIDVKQLDWAKDKNSFIYIWGWPGPDYNHHTEQTYGKGWAFTKEEILESWEK